MRDRFESTNTNMATLRDFDAVCRSHYIIRAILQHLTDRRIKRQKVVTISDVTTSMMLSELYVHKPRQFISLFSSFVIGDFCGLSRYFGWMARPSLNRYFRKAVGRS